MPELKDPPRPKNLDKTARWLSGLDGGSWFLIQKFSGDKYRITNYLERGELHWDAIFRIDHGTFYSNKNYEFAGTSDYTQCKISQNNETYNFVFVEDFRQSGHN